MLLVSFSVPLYQQDNLSGFKQMYSEKYCVLWVYTLFRILYFCSKVSFLPLTPFLSAGSNEIKMQKIQFCSHRISICKNINHHVQKQIICLYFIYSPFLKTIFYRAMVIEQEGSIFLGKTHSSKFQGPRSSNFENIWSIFFILIRLGHERKCLFMFDFPHDPKLG